MGEYAIRKSDGARIKIGTCEDMYYLRFEDREKVAPLPGNVDPVRDACELRFRLPFPDEDDIPPGQYKEFERGLRLYRSTLAGTPSACCEDFTDETTVKEPGTIQLHHPSGLLINVPCYHGHKLPDLGPTVKVFWNGKSHSLELTQLRPVMIEGELQVFPVVRCRHCGQAWRYQWADILEYIPDPVLWARLCGKYGKPPAVSAA